MEKKTNPDTESVKKKHPGGRPSLYTPELAKLICERIATHDCGIQRLCDIYDDMPTKQTIRLWKLHNSEFFSLYADAKCKQVDNFAEDTIDIADCVQGDYSEDENGLVRFNSEHVQRSRLRVDTRKWYASKLAPKIFGDRMHLETKSNEDTEALKAELKELRAKLAEKSKSEY